LVTNILHLDEARFYVSDQISRSGKKKTDLQKSKKNCMLVRALIFRIVARFDQFRSSHENVKSPFVWAFIIQVKGQDYDRNYNNNTDVFL